MNKIITAKEFLIEKGAYSFRSKLLKKELAENGISLTASADLTNFTPSQKLAEQICTRVALNSFYSPLQMARMNDHAKLIERVHKMYTNFKDNDKLDKLVNYVAKAYTKHFEIEQKEAITNVYYCVAEEIIPFNEKEINNIEQLSNELTKLFKDVDFERGYNKEFSER